VGCDSGPAYSTCAFSRVPRLLLTSSDLQVYTPSESSKAAEVALTSEFCYLECKHSGGECGERRWRYGSASLTSHP